MKKGTSLLETLISVSLISFIALISCSFLIKTKKSGQICSGISKTVIENSVSLSYIGSIIRNAGEGIDVGRGFEFIKNGVIVRKAYKSFTLNENLKKGDKFIKISSNELKKGKKIMIENNIYKITEKSQYGIKIENAIEKDIQKQEKLILLKEYYICYKAKKGLCLKIDRGYKQLISPNFKNIKFSSYNNFSIMMAGKEIRGKKWKNFKFYVFMPYIYLNGGEL